MDLRALPGSCSLAARGALLLALAGCSSPREPSSAKDAPPAGEVRRVQDLPERHRALWRAWLADDPAWSELRAEARSDPELVGFLVDNLVRELIGAYRAGEFTTPGSERIGRFERARAELIVLGEEAAPVLAELMSIAASDIAEVASGVLQEIGRPAVVPVAAQLERADLEQARMRAAVVLARLPHALGDEPAVRARLAERLARDPHWLVRSKCAEALGRRGYADVETAPAREALVAALADEDDAVRVAAAEGLAHLRDPEAVPALIAYYERSIDAGELEGMRTALAALRALTGVRESLDARGWRDWWRDHRGSLRRGS